MSEPFIAIVDFETTGLIREGTSDYLLQPGIVQMGAVVLDGGFKVLRQLSMLVNPDIAASHWSQKAIEVHGIKPSEVASEPTFLTAYKRLAETVLGAQFWSGYNTKFDRDVLWFQLMRYGLERNFPWPPAEVDAMSIASRKLGFVPGKRHDKWKLTDAYQKVFGKPLESAHDALSDVIGTGELIAEIGRDWF